MLLCLAFVACCGACSGGPPLRVDPPRATISILAPRCAGVDSCLVGHVTTTTGAAPIAKAAVFLERELQRGEVDPVRMQALTDEQGVFTIHHPPPGNYRIAVYKGDSSVELMGMELGREGTTILPVHLAR